MTQKTKRKHRTPPRWLFPRAFRYEVKGDLQSVIQAIESLQERFYSHEVQISLDALDDEAVFSVYRYGQLIQANAFSSDKNGPIQVEAHGYIRSLQPGYVVVEGNVWMGERGCSYAIFMVTMFIGGLILFTLQPNEVVLCGIPTALMLIMTAVLLYRRQPFFENFFKVLLETLQAHPMLSIDNVPLKIDQASQTSLHSKKNLKHKPAWWQFPYRFSYRVGGSYENVLQILESLEEKQPGSWVNVMLYPDGKDDETAFTLDFRVHGKYGDWNVETRIAGYVRKQEGSVVLDAILMEAHENRVAIIGIFAFIVLFLFGYWAFGAPVCGLGAALVTSLIALVGARSNRSELFNHLLEGLQKAKIPIFVLTEDEKRELLRIPEDQTYETKSAL